ncbi:MAG: hypothetical protein ACPGWR_17785 [Ardenticatenaceae bacterium]
MRGNLMQYEFEPIAKIWRFHVIYFVVTMALSWSMFPFPTSFSMFLVSMLSALGIVLDVMKKSMAAHILAVAIGLGTPVVVFATLLPYQTILFFACFTGLLYLVREHLF